MDSKLRFTDRVSSYVKSRPGYPREVIELLREECGLGPAAVVADIGSGTGMLSRMLLENAQTVCGVEPNQAMREAAKADLAQYANFLTVDGCAENTALASTSVDLITVAQAFHWFNQDDARHEFLRVLKPNGWTALIWNDRRLEGTPIAEAYERLLLEFGTDYEQVRSRGKASVENLDRFFGHSEHKRASFENSQALDREGFIGRALSASYMPNEGHPRYEAMVSQLKQIFDENQGGGHVTLEYTTNVYYGQMT